MENVAIKMENDDDEITHNQNGEHQTLTFTRLSLTCKEMHDVLREAMSNEYTERLRERLRVIENVWREPLE
jgi:hypothetical protein